MLSSAATLKLIAQWELDNYDAAELSKQPIRDDRPPINHLPSVSPAVDWPDEG